VGGGGRICRFCPRRRNPGYDKISIDLFCEKVLIQQGRSDEAYRRFGLGAATGTTNLAIYRSLVRTYPERDRRQLLLDLIKTAVIRAMVCRCKGRRLP